MLLRLFSPPEVFTRVRDGQSHDEFSPRRGVVRLIPADLYTPSPMFNVLEVLGNRNKADDHEFVIDSRAGVTEFCDIFS